MHWLIIWQHRKETFTNQSRDCTLRKSKHFQKSRMWCFQVDVTSLRYLSSSDTSSKERQNPKALKVASSFYLTLLCCTFSSFSRVYLQKKNSSINLGINFLKQKVSISSITDRKEACLVSSTLIPFPFLNKLLIFTA